MSYKGRLITSWVDVEKLKRNGKKDYEDVPRE